jgi:hypothetical protein
MIFLLTTLLALGQVFRSALRAPLISVGALVAFGIMVPRAKGFDFLDVRLILACAAIPMLFVGPAITSLLTPGSEARQSRTDLFAHLTACTLYGWMIGLLVLGLGLVTVHLTERPPEFVLPAQGVLPAYAVLSLLAALFIAAAGAYLGLLFSPAASRNLLRLLFLILLFGFYAGTRYLPLDWQVALGSTAGMLRASWWTAGVLALATAGLWWALAAAPQWKPEPPANTSAG